MKKIVAGSIDLKIGDWFITAKSLDHFSPEDVWLVENTRYDVVEGSEPGMVDLSYWNLEYRTRGSLAWDAGEVNLESVNKQVNTPGVICEFNGEQVKVVEDTDSFLESYLMDNMKTILIPTGLYGEDDLRILDSLIGQLSDGLWEDNPRMQKYAKYIDYKLGENNEIMIRVPENYSWWLNFDSQREIKEWIAKRLKQLVKQIAEWHPNDGYEWKRDNSTQFSGFFHKPEPTVQDVYRVYDKLLGRIDRIGADKYIEDLNEEDSDDESTYYAVYNEDGDELQSFESRSEAVKWCKENAEGLNAFSVDKINGEDNVEHIYSVNDSSDYNPAEDEKRVDIFISWMMQGNLSVTYNEFKDKFGYHYDDAGEEVNKPSWNEVEEFIKTLSPILQRNWNNYKVSWEGLFDKDAFVEDVEDLVLCQWNDEEGKKLYLKLRKAINGKGPDEACSILGKVFPKFDDYDIRDMYKMLKTQKITEIDPNWFSNLSKFEKMDSKMCPVKLGELEKVELIEEADQKVLFRLDDVDEIEEVIEEGKWNVINTIGDNREPPFPSIYEIDLEKRTFDKAKEAFVFARDKIKEISDVYGYNFVEVWSPEKKQIISATNEQYFDDDNVKPYLEDDSLIEAFELKDDIRELTDSYGNSIPVNIGNKVYRCDMLTKKKDNIYEALFITYLGEVDDVYSTGKAIFIHCDKGKISDGNGIYEDRFIPEDDRIEILNDRFGVYETETEQGENLFLTFICYKDMSFNDIARELLDRDYISSDYKYIYRYVKPGDRRRRFFATVEDEENLRGSADIEFEPLESDELIETIKK